MYGSAILILFIVCGSSGLARRPTPTRTTTESIFAPSTRTRTGSIFASINDNKAGRSVDKSAVELIYTNDYTYLPTVSNFVYIKVKSEGQVHIVMTKVPHPYSERYKFSLRNSSVDYTGNSFKSEFLVDGRVRATLETSNIVSSTEFIEFLIYWQSDIIFMSRIGDPFPLFYWNASTDHFPGDNYYNIKYIGIRVGDSCPSPSQENHWMINCISSPINLSDVFDTYFNSSSNPLLKTETSETELPRFANGMQPYLTDIDLIDFANGTSTESPETTTYIYDDHEGGFSIE